jgi:hypothetical protein
VSADDLQTIQNAAAEAGKDLQLMQALIAQYQKADASAQPGLLNQIQSAMNGLQATLNEVLPALHITDAAAQAKITAVLGVLLAEVESMAAIVPLVDGGGSEAVIVITARQGNKQPPLTAREFRESYNATMTAKTGNLELDRATAGMRIHLHEKSARRASAGLLK